ncbi:hypothetical protein M378DRAFT_168859 [Amanita muscaria Koide BX008]|uniref:Uncharacterized protein n=1 Tax=Amanita muscaria (strain Koide BX008) TaxID=946122 RepID=A0A0C2WEB7_AMAMK|nr:hypothetical protein M378DRAFT_168859 [Amanita muscaria Koide BX008]
MERQLNRLSYHGLLSCRRSTKDPRSGPPRLGSAVTDWEFARITLWHERATCHASDLSLVRKWKNRKWTYEMKSR